MNFTIDHLLEIFFMSKLTIRLKILSAMVCKMDPNQKVKVKVDQDLTVVELIAGNNYTLIYI